MTRTLITFAGGRGHLLPMLPLARALREAGHRLALSEHPSVVAHHGVFDEVLPHVPGSGERATPGDQGTGTLTRPDLEHEFAVIGRWYAGALAERNAEHTTERIRTWAPDLVVCDEMDFGSVVAAEAAGIPVVVVAVIASGALTRASYVVDPLAALRERHGLGPDPTLSRRWGDLAVCPFPLSLRDPGFPLPAAAVWMRPDDPPAGPTHPAASWLAGSARPGVYLTLGTVFNTESGDLFTRILDALAELPVRVLATVGSDVDPTRIGVTAPGVRLRLERFVPQAQVLPYAGVVVNHGGSGSLMGALGHGVPVVAVPMGADQELNGERLRAAGAGVVLDSVTSTSAQFLAAVSAALDGAGLHGARAIQREIAELPSAVDAVPAVEALLR